MKSNPTNTERDARVTELSEQLVEIERRLIPTGLHVFGRAAELKEKTDLLRMGASFERPEHGARALTALVADALGLDPDVLSEEPNNETNELIHGLVADGIFRFCE